MMTKQKSNWLEEKKKGWSQNHDRNNLKYLPKQLVLMLNKSSTLQTSRSVSQLQACNKFRRDKAAAQTGWQRGDGAALGTQLSVPGFESADQEDQI